MCALLSLVPGSHLPVAEAQPPARLAYTLDDGGSIRVFGISPDSGALTALGVVPGAADPRAVVVDPSGRFLYVTSSGRVLAFAISGAGLSERSAVALSDPGTLAIEPTGRFLYVAERHTARLYRLRLRADGSLTALAPAFEGQAFAAVTLDPTGQFLYALGATDGRLYAFAIDPATGTLTLVAAPSAGGTHAAALGIEPRGRSLYVLHPHEGRVTMFRLDAASGVPAPAQTIAVKDPSAIAFERTGRFLYVASPGHDAVFGYRISQANGTLTESSVEVLDSPRPGALAIDPTNRFLYATSATAATVVRLAIDGADGRLQELSSEPAGGRPVAVAIAHAIERFLFTRDDWDDPSVHAIRIGATDGTLSAAATQPLASSGTASVVDVSGRFLYVLRASAREIDAFRLDLVTGQPSHVQTLLVGGGQGVVQEVLAAEPTGRFLFVACTCATAPLGIQIRTLRIDPATGALSDVGGADAEGISSSLDAVTDLTGRFLYVANGNGGGIRIFSVNQATGIATAQAAFTGNVPSARLVMDPLGRFLYAPTVTGTLHAFRVSSTTGTLTAVGVLAMEDGTRAAAIAPTGRFFYTVTRAPGGSDSITSVHGFVIDRVSGALDASTIPLASVGNVMRPTSASIDASGRFLRVGHSAGFGVTSGVTTYDLNAASGAPVTIGSLVTPYVPSGFVTSGPVK